MFFFFEEKGASVEGGTRNRLEFGAHIHGHMEWVLMLSGSARATVDFCDYRITEGDAFFVFPNQVHQYYDDKVKECIVFIFQPSLCPELQRVFERKTPSNPILPNAASDPEFFWLSTRIAELLHTLQNPDGTKHYLNSLLRGYFLALSSLVLQRVELIDEEISDPTAIKRILLYCNQNFTSDLSLDKLAAELHMSKFYISHLFHKKLHMGIRSYINMLRIAEAQRLLATGEQFVTEIAFQVGFNSIRSFNRAFFEQTKMTPSIYRANSVSNPE